MAISIDTTFTTNDGSVPVNLGLTDPVEEEIVTDHIWEGWGERDPVTGQLLNRTLARMAAATRAYIRAVWRQQYEQAILRRQEREARKGRQSVPIFSNKADA